jgi:hypothetical protein
MNEFWSQGGSYILNGVTGELELIERTMALEEVVTPVVDPTVSEPSVSELFEE